jgi:hypothetical protein
MMSAKTKTTIGFILLFLFGMIFGVAFTLIIEGGIIKRALANPNRGWEILAKRISRELNLTPEQRTALDEILLETQDGLQKIREQVGPSVDELLDNSRGRIEGILTVKQQDRFHQMYDRLQGARERYRNMGRMRHMRGFDEEDATGSDNEMPMRRW